MKHRGHPKPPCRNAEDGRPGHDRGRADGTRCGGHKDHPTKGKASGSKSHDDGRAEGIFLVLPLAAAGAAGTAIRRRAHERVARRR